MNVTEPCSGTPIPFLPCVTVISRHLDELRAGLKRHLDTDSQSGDAGQETGPGDIEPTPADSAGDAHPGTAEAMARAYEVGLGVDFSALFVDGERHKIRLPGYPFQRRRFWVEKKT